MTNAEILRAYAAIARREKEREYRERIAKGRAGLAIAKAAKKAGLPVKSVTVEGIVLQLGEPETNEIISANPWDEIYAPEQQRPS